MEKELKRVYTVNIKPSVMEAAKQLAQKDKRSVSAHVEILMEKNNADRSEELKEK